jgi:hypothetical protein
VVLGVASGYADASDAQPSVPIKVMKEYGLGKPVPMESLKQADDRGKWK